MFGYESKRINIESRAVPTIFKNKIYDITEMDGETVIKPRTGCKSIQQSEQHAVMLLSQRSYLLVV